MNHSTLPHSDKLTMQVLYGILIPSIPIKYFLGDYITTQDLRHHSKPKDLDFGDGQKLKNPKFSTL